ncbi:MULTISPECIES: PadR family transcriptional regulator [Hyphobacterium]|uniref:PadR family transcriptional regulator n=1 Tax=Hyphobacterium vulgare TaxID=1736751 RepID=A0ABV7A0N3_9PROT
MTELEGAILTLLDMEGPMTAYGVRRAFLDSPSSFWSASAGAIYPALNRMEEAGWVASKDATRGKRPAKALQLTASGKAEISRWAIDTATAIGPGFDPFRLRAPLWMRLEVAERAELKAALESRVLKRIEVIDALDPRHPDALRHALERVQQTTRLEWIRKTL